MKIFRNSFGNHELWYSKDTKYLYMFSIIDKYGPKNSIWVVLTPPDSSEPPRVIIILT